MTNDAAHRLAALRRERLALERIAETRLTEAQAGRRMAIGRAAQCRELRRQGWRIARLLLMPGREVRRLLGEKA